MQGSAPINFFPGYSEVCTWYSTVNLHGLDRNQLVETVGQLFFFPFYGHQMLLVQ
jgi:hypothetical protein